MAGRGRWDRDKDSIRIEADACKDWKGFRVVGGSCSVSLVTCRGQMDGGNGQGI